jgi:hypothetical protein
MSGRKKGRSKKRKKSNKLSKSQKDRAVNRMLDELEYDLRAIGRRCGDDENRIRKEALKLAKKEFKSAEKQTHPFSKFLVRWKAKLLWKIGKGGSLW